MCRGEGGSTVRQHEQGICWRTAVHSTRVHPLYSLTETLRGWVACKSRATLLNNSERQNRKGGGGGGGYCYVPPSRQLPFSEYLPLAS